MSNPLVIEVKNLSKAYLLPGEKVLAIKDVSFGVAQGDFVVLAGPSGSGKSTMLNLLGGLDIPDSGSILINGENIHAVGETALADFRRNKLGFVFQSFSLFPVLTVFENVEYSLLLRNIKKPERKAIVMDSLESVGLADYGFRFPAQLSGGQQQRVAVARAMAGKPEYILADEPTANLDVHNATALIELMQKINSSRKVTFIIASHDNRVISRARSILFLEDGKLLPGTPQNESSPA